MRILVTGATGLIGHHLCRQLLSLGHQLTVVTRSKTNYNENVGLPAFILEHDLMKEPLKASPILESIEVIIHLAGENIAKSRWSKDFKQKLYDSRINTTKNLLAPFNELKQKKLSLVICASGVGIYTSSDQECDEQTPTREDTSFFSHLCHKWERCVSERCEKLSVRSIQARFGAVLARDGGMLTQLEPYARSGFLGKMPGKDFWLSWIHIEDAVRALIFCIENSEISGAVNLTSVEPCLYSKFIYQLNQTFKKKDFLPPPKFLLSILHGEIIDVLTRSHRIFPQKLIRKGFSFEFQDINTALKNLYKNFLLPLRFETTQWIPRDKSTVFDLFLSLKNLKKITPEWLNFEWIGTPPLKLDQNTELTYKMSIYGLNIKSKTKITSYKPPNLFIDEQTNSLFDKWRHIHQFQSFAGGTLIIDRMNYQLSYNLNLLVGPKVQSDMKKLFNHRKQKLLELLGVE